MVKLAWYKNLFKSVFFHNCVIKKLHDSFMLISSMYNKSVLSQKLVETKIISTYNVTFGRSHHTSEWKSAI